MNDIGGGKDNFGVIFLLYPIDQSFKEIIGKEIIGVKDRDPLGAILSSDFQTLPLIVVHTELLLIYMKHQLFVGSKSTCLDRGNIFTCLIADNELLNKIILEIWTDCFLKK